jgi:hypothetical protein
LETKGAIARYRKEQTSKVITEKDPQKQESALMKISGAADKVLDFTGGSKISEALGKGIARGTFGDTIQKAVVGEDLSPEAEARVAENPSGLQLAGDVARTGLNFTPMGRIAGAVGSGLAKIGLGAKASRFGGAVATGAGTGAAFDVAEDVAEDQEIGLGAGTAIGAGIPAGTPLLGAIGRASAKFAGKGTAEISGALTGTSAETIEQAFIAAQKGGDEAEAFTQAMRGNTTPEQLVNSLRTGVSAVNQNRQAIFRDTLQELGDTTVNTGVAKTSLVSSLTDAGITVSENGILDFSQSKLRTVPAAQTKIQQAFAEVNRLGDSITLQELDTSRQALKALRTAGDDPSANLANKLIDDAVRGTRTAGEEVVGYGQMLDNFEAQSEFLEGLERGLSTGDRATVDQTYRRMATTLRTNNEQRMALLRELDEFTDGAILSEIAGQQLSEAMPRGIFRQISAGIAGGAVLTGGVSTSLLPALVFASPRATGEFVRALGMTKAKTDAMIEAIAVSRETLTKAGLITEAGVNASSDLEEDVDEE